ncbi:hypothetical protein ES707_03376 [subsurface metagenome]
MSQIAGLADFRQEAPPADIGLFQFPASILVFNFIFSGTTYVCAVRAGVSGWVPLDYGTDPATVIQSALNALTVGRTWKEKVVLKGSFELSASIEVFSYTSLILTDTQLTVPNGADYSIIKIEGTDVDHRNHVEIISGILEGDNPTANQHGIEMSYVFFSHFEHIYITKTNRGIYADGELRDSIFLDVVVRETTGYGWFIWGDVAGGINEVTLFHCEAYACTDWGVILNNIAGCRFIGFFSASNTLGFRASNGEGCFFILCDSDSNGAGTGYSFDNLNHSSMISCWSATNDLGVEWSGSDGISITGGFILNLNKEGIKLTSITRAVILGVSVEHPASINPNLYDALHIIDSTRIIVRDSFLTDPHVTPTMRYGVYSEGTSDYVSVFGCDVSDAVTLGINLSVGVNNIVRGNIGFVTENNLLSPAFAIDAVAVVAVVIAHGLDVTPAVEDCQLTLIEDTDVDDFTLGWIKVESTGAANVNCKVNVTGQSATGGATAKLALHVDLAAG